MIPKTTIDSLVALGQFFESWAGALSDPNKEQSPSVQKAVAAAHTASGLNGWFTHENIILSLNSWAKELTPSKIESWLNSFSFDRSFEPKRVGLILAGNIPMVGLHDLISVLVSGHIAQIKLSSDDSTLLPVVIDFLSEINPSWKEKLILTQGIMKDADAYIATGSNNSARYFEYYFGRKPCIIRKNRSSVAVLNGHESTEDLRALGLDIFSYFGLGCRNVSKLMVPEGYQFNNFFESIVEYGYVINNKKYGNNYDYHRAVYLLDSVQMLDNNFLLLKNDSSWSSPIGVLFYERYKNTEDLKARLNSAKDNLQCIVAHDLPGFNTVKFGQSQNPSLSDYADGVNTLEFLAAL